MEITEEKPKKGIVLYVVIFLLILAIAAVYLIFFAPERTGGGFLDKIFTLFSGQVKDFSLVPEHLKKDVTGGIINLKFEPKDILENPVFQSLRSYAEPVEITTLGRPNPFIPY